MNIQNTNEQLVNLDEVTLSLKAVYGLTEAEISKAEMALFHKMGEIEKRIKKLEDHLLVSVIHNDM